jgi:hypothetical protein
MSRSKRSQRRAQWLRKVAKQERRAPPALVLVTGTRKPVWVSPVWREMADAEAEIHGAYSRFRPDHPMHMHEPDYAPDYTSEGARVLTWKPPTVTAPAVRMAA